MTMAMIVGSVVLRTSTTATSPQPHTFSSTFILT